ncbi:MAG: PilW family protein [Burkholderiaceae bacterium]|nr:PilW family protein [Burkholderiaceae bacterium]
MEILVGMTIGVITLLIVMQLFMTTEGTKRTTTGASDAQQAGSFSTYALERQLRLAGTGFAHMSSAIWGCPLRVWRSNASMVPLPNDLSPASTTYVNHFKTPIDSGLSGQSLRMTPVLIVNGGGNADADAGSASPDTLIVMAGQHESATLPYLSTNTAPSTTSASIVNTVGINQNDLLIARDVNPTPGVTDCRVVQATDAVSPATAVGVVPNPVNFAGGTYTPSSGTQALSGYSGSFQLGNLGSEPAFFAYALGSDGTTSDSLLSYNLFGGALASLADNIVNLQAVYGVAGTWNSPDVASWQAPTGVWAANALMDGSAASADRIQRIRAVRLVIVARSAQYEKAADWTAPTLPLLSDLNGATPAANMSMTFSGNAQRFRYRSYDITVPLRNMLLKDNV